MRTIADVTPLCDQVVVRCLGTADKQGSIWIPLSAQEARQIHRSGGDYIHRGEVVACGPGDKAVLLACSRCFARTMRHPKRVIADENVFTLGKCMECGGELAQMFHTPTGLPVESRRPMLTKPGDIVLYENRAQAQLHPTRFPSLDLEDDTLVILLEEQHILAILDSAWGYFSEQHGERVIFSDEHPTQEEQYEWMQSRPDLIREADPPGIEEVRLARTLPMGMLFSGNKRCSPEVR